MAVDSTTRRVAYAGDGKTTAFPFAFLVFNATDVTVAVGANTGGATNLAYGTDYTVALNSDQETNPGGTVTVTTAPATGYNLAITSSVPYDQPMVLTPYDGFNPETLNDNSDRQCVQIQQLVEKASRAITVAETDTRTPSQLLDDIFDTEKAGQASAAAAAQSAATAKQSANESAQSAANSEQSAKAAKESRDDVYANHDAWKEAITAEGDKQVERITAEGDKQVERITAEGDKQVERITAEGDKQDSYLVAEGDAQADRVIDEGDKQVDRIRREFGNGAISASIGCGEYSWELAEDVPAENDIVIPSGLNYYVNRHHLRVTVNGLALSLGRQFAEVGTEDEKSSTFRLLFDAFAGDELSVWVGALGQGGLAKPEEVIKTVSEMLAEQKAVSVAVSEAQDFTTAQKTQARSNIGAASTEEVSEAKGSAEAAQRTADAAQAAALLFSNLRLDTTSAGFANSIYRGHNILDYFTEDEISAKLKTGDFSGLYVGDYLEKTITVNETAYTRKWYFAHFDYPHASYSGHNIVLLPSGSLGAAFMNAPHSTSGGFVNSQMFTTYLPPIAEGIKEAFSSEHVLGFKTYLTTEVDSSTASMAGGGVTGASTKNALTACTCCLMSEPQIFGHSVWGSSPYDEGERTLQFALFALDGTKRALYRGHLSAVANSTNFCFVDYGTPSHLGSGLAYSFGAAGYGLGIVPYFLYK